MFTFQCFTFFTESVGAVNDKRGEEFPRGYFCNRKQNIKVGDPEIIIGTLLEKQMSGVLRKRPELRYLLLNNYDIWSFFMNIISVHINSHTLFSDIL